jgi:hypothetical protein
MKRLIYRALCTLVVLITSNTGATGGFGLRRLSGDVKSRKQFRYVSGFRDLATIEYNYGTSITQLMFTPQDPDARKSPPGESPYVGWLGLCFSLHAKDTQALNSSELSIGTVGSNAVHGEM